MVSVWDVRSSKKLASLSTSQSGNGAVRVVKFSPDGEYLAFSEHRSYFHIVDTRSYNDHQKILVPSISALRDGEASSRAVGATSSNPIASLNEGEEIIPPSTSYNEIDVQMRDRLRSLASMAGSNSPRDLTEFVNDLISRQASSGALRDLSSSLPRPERFSSSISSAPPVASASTPGGSSWRDPLPIFRGAPPPGSLRRTDDPLDSGFSWSRPATSRHSNRVSCWEQCSVQIDLFTPIDRLLILFQISSLFFFCLSVYLGTFNQHHRSMLLSLWREHLRRNRTSNSQIFFRHQKIIRQLRIDLKVNAVNSFPYVSLP